MMVKGRRWLVAYTTVIVLCLAGAYAAVGGWPIARRLLPLAPATPTVSHPVLVRGAVRVITPTIVLPTAAPVQTSTPAGG